MASIHQFKVEGISGEEIDFADFKGKKVIVVNVASECGFTSQYQQLQELYSESLDKLVVIGFPSNDFGGQEPGSNPEIRTFCERNYGVTFPLSTKIAIQSAPIYQWLCQKTQNGVMDSEVKWNFQKYLLDETGQLVDLCPSSVSPLDPIILDWVNS
ncbi:MAG: glutathione peroxidase [Bacteroidota bacterium]